jgi:hypothetical protein
MIKKFKALLDVDAPKGKQKEQYVQDFMEENTEFLPTPGLLNHRLHMGSVISKFPIDVSLICDYAYITKSSIKWEIYLVELEKPEKKIFKETKGQVGFTAEFNNAVAQIRSWKIFVDSSSAILKQRLLPLLQPIGMRDNQIEYCYVLVYGRNSEYMSNNEKRAALATFMNSEKIRFYTYDSIISELEQSKPEKKNVMRLVKTGYEFKRLHCEPQLLFSYVGPDSFSLSDAQVSTLKAWGYQIEAWQKGQFLRLNGKYVAESHEELADSVMKSLTSKT